MRRPKRDLSRPQARHGRYDWEMRWRTLWARQRVAANGLAGIAALNEHMKAIYGDKMPPGSPGRPRCGISSLFPESSLLRAFRF